MRVAALLVVVLVGCSAPEPRALPGHLYVAGDAGGNDFRAAFMPEESTYRVTVGFYVTTCSNSRTWKAKLVTRRGEEIAPSKITDEEGEG
ncbi:MAG TPA: hypothetical protein VFF73_13225 [Planctomycetota bacterium]|nr:hypothetical protein [Planctomycetota bacterium]